jgi:hypothetical protein
MGMFAAKVSTRAEKQSCTKEKRYVEKKNERNRVIQAYAEKQVVMYLCGKARELIATGVCKIIAHRATVS